MKCDMDFKFGMGDAVRFRMGKHVCEGTVTARMEAGVHPHYMIQIGNGIEFEVSEKHLKPIGKDGRPEKVRRKKNS
jgi:hypothetical protein